MPPAGADNLETMDSVSSRLRVLHGRHGLGLAAALLGVLGFGSGDRPAEAYRLYDNGALDYIVPSSEAIRWSDDAWGPGRTLLWEIEDGPDWVLLNSSAQDMARVVESALAWFRAFRSHGTVERLSFGR